jgi:hypothetical protein
MSRKQSFRYPRGVSIQAFGRFFEGKGVDSLSFNACEHDHGQWNPMACEKNTTRGNPIDSLAIVEKVEIEV